MRLAVKRLVERLVQVVLTWLVSAALSCLSLERRATLFQTTPWAALASLMSMLLTEVQGNQGGAERLGRLIGSAVAELIKQKRPGGLLTR